MEKERLLNGNWKIRPAAGLYFPREHARIVKTVPEKIVAVARAWDLAATEITPANFNSVQAMYDMIQGLMED